MLRTTTLLRIVLQSAGCRGLNLHRQTSLTLELSDSPTSDMDRRSPDDRARHMLTETIRC